MKKTLLIAAALIMGLGSANAQLSSTYSSDKEWNVTLGEAITSLDDLTDGTYVMYNEYHGASTYLLDPNSTTGNYTYTTATDGPSIYNVVKVTSTSTTGAYTIETYSGFIKLTGATLHSALPVSSSSDNLYFTASDGVTMNKVTTSAGSTMIYLGTYSATYATATVTSLLGSALETAPQNVIPRGSGYKANRATAVHFVKVTVTEKTYLDDLKAAVGDYFATNVGNYFAMSQDYYDANHETYEGYVSAGSCTKDEYETMSAAVKADVAANVPESGWYRIKNYSFETYAGYNQYGAVSSLSNTDVASVLYLENKDGKYAIQIAGQYLQVPTRNKQISLGNDPEYYTFEAAEAPGVFRAVSETASTVYMNETGESGNYGICGWDANSLKANPGSYWYIEDAKTATKTLTQVGEKYYATLYAPFPAKIDGATAYGISTVTSEDGAMTANDEEIGTTIAGGEPVILVGSGSSVTLTITDESVEKSSSNVLAGSYQQIETVEGCVLSYKNGDTEPGFYKQTTGYPFTANSAYLPTSALPSGTSARIAINFGSKTTGINAAQKTVENGKVYDLQGREVKQMTKGLYIVNGKKVIK